MSSTQALTPVPLDIDRINNAIENMRKPLERRRKEEPVIHAGYSVPTCTSRTTS